MRYETLKARLDHVAITLKSGALVVLRTDTLYGILARADDATAVARLQKVRDREPGKAFITLIDTPAAAYGDDQAKITAAYAAIPQTGPTSIIIENSDAPAHLLHRDGSLAYRVPAVAELTELLGRTGPLVAPSANIAGETPARSVDEAQAYFGDAVALYIDDGQTPEDQQPSSVIKVAADGTIVRLR